MRFVPLALAFCLALPGLAPTPALAPAISAWRQALGLLPQ